MHSRFPLKNHWTIVISDHMFGVRFRKTSEANACERGGSGCDLCSVCFFCVCSFPIRNCRQGQRFDLRGQLHTRFCIFSDTFFKEVCLSL